jgi:hypothetical protein
MSPASDAAEQWRRGCGSSISGEDRGGADQHVARVAPLWRWFVGSGIKRRVELTVRVLGSGLGQTFSSKQAVRSGQHAGVLAQVVRGE